MKKILAILLALSMLLAMSACGGASAPAAGDEQPAVSETTPEPAPEPASDPIPESETPAGSYKLVGIAGGAGSDLEIVSAVVNLGVNFYLVLDEDGSGCMRFLEAEIPLNWDDDSIVIPPQGKIQKQLVLPYSCTDGSLNISTQAYSMDFIALTDAELADYEANGSDNVGGLVASLVQSLISSMDSDLVESLLLSLALGMMSDDAEPIPEGEPSEGPVTGTVNDLEYTVLGSSYIQDDEQGDVIVLWFDVTNCSDEFHAVWYEEIEASQGGEFLDSVFELDSVPELFNVNYDFIPGRTLRCATAYVFDPDGGVVSFRISSYADDTNVLYYADPQNLSGAPSEPFVFETDLAIPAELEALPEETENVRIENAEFFTDEEGDNAIRFYYCTFHDNEDEGPFHFSEALQDGIELHRIWNDDVSDGEQNLVEGASLRTHACKLRTGSPVILIVYEETEDGTDVPVASKVFEIS